MPKWRPGIEAGRRLFRKGTLEEFEAALRLHARVCARIASDDKAARKGKKVKKSAGRYRWGDVDLVRRNLPQNDLWMQRDLPRLLKENGRMDKEDMRRLLAWKWAYGKYRPGKRRFEDMNQDEEVVQATGKAVSLMNAGLESAGDSDTEIDSLVTSAVELLTTMPQVGPATATAILAAGYPSQGPFYADEAIESTGMFREPYTLGRYLEFAQQLRVKAKELGSGCWNANKVARALWAVSKADSLGMSFASASSSDSAARPNKRRKKN